MNGEHVQESPVEVPGIEFERDMQAAARSRVPVLISGSPQRALMLAQAIAGRLSGAHRGLRILACDEAHWSDLGGTITARDWGETSRTSILFLREVHALNQTGQFLLRRLMVQRPLDAPRIVTSSSVSLNRRVKEGLFDPELFYYLNTIHIVTSRPGRTGEDR